MELQGCENKRPRTAALDMQAKTLCSLFTRDEAVSRRLVLNARVLCIPKGSFD